MTTSATADASQADLPRSLQRSIQRAALIFFPQGANDNPKGRKITMNNKNKLLNAAAALLLLGVSASARAEGAKAGGGAAAAARADIAKTLGFVPQFFLKFPEEALPGAWDEMKSLQLNPGT